MQKKTRPVLKHCKIKLSHLRRNRKQSLGFLHFLVIDSSNGFDISGWYYMGVFPSHYHRTVITYVVSLLSNVYTMINTDTSSVHVTPRIHCVRK